MKDAIYLLGFKMVNGLIDRLKGELLDKTEVNATEECPAIQVSCKPLKKTSDKPDSRIYDCHCFDLTDESLQGTETQEPLFTVVVSSS